MKTTIFNIPTEIHFSWWFLVGYLVLSGLFSAGASGAIMGVWISAILLISVVAHEFAHALTARHFGYETRSIVMYFIGGAASIEGIERMTPKETIWISFAGPLLNLVVAAVVFLISVVMFAEFGGNITTTIMGPVIFINLILGVFNLVPAFPMDGGRILRAALETKVQKTKAKDISQMVAQFFAGIFIVYGLFGDFMLVFIGGMILAFVWAENNIEGVG